MRNWFRSWLTVDEKQKRQRRPYRPRLEGLEDRCLLSVTLDPISTQNVPSGKSLILPLTATDTNGNALTYTVTSSDPQITATLHTGDPFVKFTVAGFGDLVFQLFQDLTPKTVSTIGSFIKSEFYNNLTFHRIVPGFVIQGGDPAGDGTGGPGFQFDDEFNLSAIFSGNGQLALANAGKDTNGSQFFVTIGPQRSLDFNHAIFGQLVRGFDVLSKIAAVPTDSNNKPLTPVVISNAQFITDTADNVVTLTAAAGFTGTATITVQATNSQGDRSTQVFQATAAADTQQDPAVLGPGSDQVTPAGTPLTFTLTGMELGTAPLKFEALEQDATMNATVTVTPGAGNTATVTVTPNAGFTGPIKLKVGVEISGATNRNEPGTDPFDTQNITVAVGDQPLTGTAATINATEGTALSDVVVATFTDADPNATASDFTATVNFGQGDTKVPPDALPTGTITKGADGTFTVTASQTTAYREAGKFPVTVMVKDQLGATATINSSATVADAALSVSGTTLSTTQGVPLTNATVATFTDTDPNALASDFTATIDWGDGTTTTGTIAAGGGNNMFTVAGTHTYTAQGNFSPKVTVNDVVPAGDVTGATASATSTATVAAGSGGTTRGFIQKLYQDVLGRDADDFGFTYFGGLLDSGQVNRSQVALAVETSFEARSREIQQIYMQILGRAADPLGLNNCIEYLALGGSLAQVRVVLASSPEFYQTKGGGTNSGYLTALYQVGLGRAIDPTGLAADMQAFANGANLIQIAETVFTSAEIAGNTATSLLNQFLHRSNDVGNVFTGALTAGVYEELAEMVILGSDEYFNRP
jgi:cyclophilin family peptidyl-prolyl cis-trans isomerase